MVRIGLKYLVPLCAVSFTAALVLAGYQEGRHREEVWGPPSSWDGPPPRGYDLVVALNAPAVLAAAPGVLVVASTTHLLDGESLPWWTEALLGIYFSIFILAQWILIGRWLGGHQKPRSATPAGSVRRSVFIFVVGIVVSLGFVCFGIIRMKESGWMSTWIPGAGITAWSLIAATILASRLHRVLASR